MTSFRVGRNKVGDLIQVMLEDARGVMRGFLLTDEEARGLADGLLGHVRPTAADLTHDKGVEP